MSFRRVLNIVIVILLLCVFTSCIKTGVGVAWRDIGLSYAVPDGRLADLKGHHHDVLETDEQGRELMSFQYRSHFSDNEYKTAVVILQKHDQEYVYFYEDQCYRYGEPSDEILSELKEINDWGKPLDESKMSKRKMGKTIDGYLRDYSCDKLDYNAIQTATIKSIDESIWQDQDSFCIMDSDQHGKFVFVLSTKSGGLYAVMIEDYKVAAFTKFSSYNAIPEEYAQFKHENGWNYG